MQIQPNWKMTDHTEKCRRKPGRMAERSKVPDSRNSSVENSGTRVCAWVRIPLLSENLLNTMRQSLQLTNSVILERQFKMTVQSKKKTQRSLWLITEWFECTKIVNQKRYVKHECTRGFERKSLQVDDTNRLAEEISEIQIQPNWKITDHTEKCRRKPGRMAERSKAPDSRKSSVDNSGTRRCACVRIRLLSDNVLNTMRQSLQLTNSVILERQFKMTVQSKKKTQRSLWLITEWFKSAQKKIPRRDKWNTIVRVGLNANLYKWMTQTV